MDTHEQLAVALKEWAAVCAALANGQQRLILRKGGIVEDTPDGRFHLVAERFWLYPTYLHQQEQGCKPTANPLLAQALAERPAPGTVRLTHWARVVAVAALTRLDQALALDGWHILTEATIRARFAYREPGLTALVVQVHRATTPHTITETAAYAGCRSWVQLSEPLTAGGRAVVADDDFARWQHALLAADSSIQWQQLGPVSTVRESEPA